MTDRTRPSRTWRHWLGLAVVLVVGLVVWATVTDKQQPTQPLSSSLVTAEPSPPDEVQESSAAPPALSADDAGKQNDKGWVLENYSAHPSYAGDLTMIARIKNANRGTSSGFFTMSLLNGAAVVATWHGVANGVTTGTTVTVTMLTQDSVPKGVKASEMQFQTDTSLPA